MFRLLLVSALAVVAIGASPRHRPRAPALDGRIVGGEDAEIEDYPYQVSLLSSFSESHFCGGSILTSNKILTAAHCTDGDSPSNVLVRRSSSIKNSGGVVHNVIDISIHPEYTSYASGYDVSILTLADDIEWSSSSQQIGLVGPGPHPSGRIAVVTGWGATQAEFTDQLQVVHVEEVSNEDCNESYGEGSITDTMNCFASPGKDSCQGDSGGPLVVDGAQVGIVSWGRGCALPDYPGVYADVESLRDYILGQL